MILLFGSVVWFLCSIANESAISLYHCALSVYYNVSMSRYELHAVPASKDIALLFFDAEAGLSYAHIYPEYEQYPLATDRYVRNRRNLFVDIIDILDGNNPFSDDDAAGKRKTGTAGSTEILETGASSAEDIKDYPSISLETLAKNAAHRSADGSGNARRFKDARDLWSKIGERVEAGIVKAGEPPITDVRKTKNWKKNQPNKNVAADPQAWYVTSVYARSNVKKNPIFAYHGLFALLDSFDDSSKAEQNGKTELSSAASRIKEAAERNLDYPVYGEISTLTGDSNMLVFHSNESLAQWLKKQYKEDEFIHPECPAEICCIPDPDIKEEDERYLPAKGQITVAKLVKALSAKPKKK